MSLVDPFGRRIEYPRVSVTRSLQLYRCFYCMPAARICVTSRPCRWARKHATDEVVSIPMSALGG